MICWVVVHRVFLAEVYGGWVAGLLLIEHECFIQGRNHPTEHESLSFGLPCFDIVALFLVRVPVAQVGPGRDNEVRKVGSVKVQGWRFHEIFVAAHNVLFDTVFAKEPLCKKKNRLIFHVRHCASTEWMDRNLFSNIQLVVG